MYSLFWSFGISTMAQATESLFDLDLVPNNTGGANTN